MAGEAILAFVPDLMFSVQLREAAGKQGCTIAFVDNPADFSDRLPQVDPALVILDLVTVGAQVEALVRASKQSGSRIIAFGPHVQKDLLANAERAGCDAVYRNSKFKMDTEAIIAQWLAAK